MAYPPVLRGFLLIMAGGAVFPLAGLALLRMQMPALRFTFMHTGIFFCAIGAALGFNVTVFAFGANAVLAGLLGFFARKLQMDIGRFGAFLMALSACAAAAAFYKAGLEGTELSQLFWGSAYLAQPSELLLAAAYACLSLLALARWYRPICAVMLNKEAAFTAGVNEQRIVSCIYAFAGVSVLLALRFLGALALDALALLPAVSALSAASSMKSLVLLTIVFGLLSAAVGFWLSFAADLPLSAAIAAASCFLFALSKIYIKIKVKLI